MSIFSSYKKFFLLGFIIVILVAIPFSVYLAQQTQETRSRATPSTTLSFEPAQTSVEVDKTLTLDIVLDPGVGQTANQVSFVKLSIKFDPKKFTTIEGSLVENKEPPNTLTSVLESAAYDNTLGTASISLSIGADPTKVVTTKTNIATLKLKALSTTTSDNPSSITFTPAPDTQVLSIASTDGTSENVLSTTIPATATINPASSPSNPTPTSSPTPTASGGSAPPALTGTPGLGGGPSTLESTLTPTTTEAFPTEIVQQPPQILPPTGPGETVLGIGILGGILMIIGGALFILL